MTLCLKEVTKRANEQVRWWLRGVGMKWVPMPGKRPCVNYAGWFRGEMRDCVRYSSEQALSGTGNFQSRFCQTAGNRSSWGIYHHPRFGALISIELWHQQFIDCFYQ